MTVDNTSYYLRIIGRILIIFGCLLIPVSILSWSALSFMIESVGWMDFHWDGWIPLPFLGRIFMLFPGMYFIAGLIYIVGGLGLVNEKNWAHQFAWLPAVILLFNFPVGTAIGVWLIYLLQKAKEFQSNSAGE